MPQYRLPDIFRFSKSTDFNYLLYLRNKYDFGLFICQIIKKIIIWFCWCRWGTKLTASGRIEFTGSNNTGDIYANLHVICSEFMEMKVFRPSTDFQDLANHYKHNYWFSLCIWCDLIRENRDLINIYIN